MPSLGNILGGLRSTSDDEFGFWTVTNVGVPRAIPPFTVSFSATALLGHALLVGDEEGIITILDTRRSLKSQMHAERRSTQPYSRFRGHDNAIFDAIWLNDDRDIATAGGDATVRVFDASSTVRKAVLRGALGSVKCVRAHPESKSVLVSAARDGDVRIYDTRVPSVYNSRVARENYHRPVSSILQPHALRAHIVQGQKRRRIHADPPKLGTGSVTALAFQPTEPLLYTAGAADGCVKLWDLRLGKEGCKVQGCLESANPGSSPAGEDRRRVHGIASLDVDPTGKLVLASSTDSQISLYHAKQLNLGRTQILKGHAQTSFYIRAKFSHCGRFVASGSADTKAYIWDCVGGAEVYPILELDGHLGGEVSGVDWCREDGFKLATCADDSTVKVWQVTRGAKAGARREQGDQVFNGARRVAEPQQLRTEQLKRPLGSAARAGTRKLKNSDIRSFFSHSECAASTAETEFSG